MCGSHKMMDKHNVLYDDIVRVPFIISWPGHIQQEQINNNFVYNCLDLAPTIVDLLDKHGKLYINCKLIKTTPKGIIPL